MMEGEKGKQPEKKGKLRPIEIALIALNFLIVSADAIGVWMISSFLPGWLEEKGLNSNWAGFIFASNSIGGLISTLFSTIVIKMTSNTTIMVVTPAIVTVFNFLTAFIIPTLHGDAIGYLLITFRGLAGVAEGLLYVSSSSLILRVSPPELGPSMVGFAEGVRALGIVLGPVIGSPLYEVSGFWLPFFVSGLVLAIVSACLTTLILFFLPPDVNHSSKKNDSVEKQWRDGASNQGLALFAVTMLGVYPTVIVQPILEPYLLGSPFNLTSAEVGLVFGFCSIFDILGAALSGPLSMWIGPFNVLYGGNLIAIGGMIILLCGPQSFVVVTIALCMVYLGGYPTAVACLTIYQRFCKLKGIDFKEFSEVMTTMGSISVYIAFILGTALGGTLYDAIGFQKCFIVTLSTTVLIFPIMHFSFHPKVIGGKLPVITDDDDEIPVDEKATSAYCGLRCLNCKAA